MPEFNSQQSFNNIINKYLENVTNTTRYTKGNTSWAVGLVNVTYISAANQTTHAVDLYPGRI